MSLDSIVSVTITNATVTLDQEGFGIPLIVDYNTVFSSDLVRYYADVAEVEADGFDEDDFAHKAATAIFAQNPRPELVGIGRRTNAPTMLKVLTPVSAVNAAVYTVTINGVAFVYTADSATSVQEIVEGIAALVNAGTEPVTATEDNSTLTLTADVAGVPFTLSSTDNLTVQDNTANNNLATDLAALLAASGAWYGVVLTSKGQAEIAAAAEWVEANKKLMICSTADEDVRGSGSSDIASDLETAAYYRSKIMWHQEPEAFSDAAWFGKMLPQDPGSSTFEFKTLAGIDASELTSTHITNLEAKKVGYYVEIGGVNVTRESHTASGEWLDIVIGLDWLQARIQESVFALLVGEEKIPYTDLGVAQVRSVIEARLLDAVNVGLLVAGSTSVSFPLVSSISAADKASRMLPDGTFSGTLAGAIHAVEVDGTVSV